MSQSLLPKSLLYSIFARIGGPGLDTDSFEALRASYRGKFLGKAIAYDNRQREIPSRFVQSLRWHPVRLLSFLDRPYYYGAKKKYLDWIASRHLNCGHYDFFHSWSGDCLETLRAAKKRKIPSLIEIPTWHRGSQRSEDRGQIVEVALLVGARKISRRIRTGDAGRCSFRKSGRVFSCGEFPG